MKHYTNKKDNRQEIMQVNRALTDLSKLNIKIISVIFRKPLATILIEHCAGNDALKSSYKGQEIKGNQKYVWRVAQVQGCQVHWREKST